MAAAMPEAPEPTTSTSTEMFSCAMQRLLKADGQILVFDLTIVNASDNIDSYELVT
jgi:hypothetical protein